MPNKLLIPNSCQVPNILFDKKDLSEPAYAREVIRRFAERAYRGPIAPAELDRLKAHNILYERDSSGEYFQAYTGTFDERFFFEIVERRGGYKGFGASNAQIRLTAQARSARHVAIPRR